MKDESSLNRSTPSSRSWLTDTSTSMLDWSIRGKEEEEEEKKANLEEVGKEKFEAAVKGAMRSGRQMVLTA
ncbi:hypothetical protein OUZ56_031351 [Daphnia magna]|uniref:Uncharacterized protein n=1 Tax=Daphnia magna TaxID=35525 RepID=A0ABQ9ZTZ5_9CRUS|nr:hypothetical protein OUZ56_031351 [Daphnia magna]